MFVSFFLRRVSTKCILCLSATRHEISQGRDLPAIASTFKTLVSQL